MMKGEDLSPSSSGPWNTNGIQGSHYLCDLGKLLPLSEPQFFILETVAVLISSKGYKRD